MPDARMYSGTVRLAFPDPTMHWPLSGALVEVEIDGEPHTDVQKLDLHLDADDVAWAELWFHDDPEPHGYLVMGVKQL